MAEATSGKTFQFDLVSPERVVLSATAEMVVAPGVEGEFGVMAEHAPLIAALKAGAVTVYRNGQIAERLYVGGGVAEVGPAGLTILAEEAGPTAELDRARLDSEIKDLREDLGLAKDEAEKTRLSKRIDIAEAKLALAA